MTASSDATSSSGTHQSSVENDDDGATRCASIELLPTAHNNLAPRSLSAPSSRTSSFSSGLDQLALINQSAHIFPANLASLASTSTDSTYRTLSTSVHGRTARSTPSSPRLGPSSPQPQHHERRAFSRPVSPSFSRRGSGSGHGSLHPNSLDEPWRIRRKRARSWMNTPGAGFTPAVAPEHPPRGSIASIASRHVRSQRHASTPDVNPEIFHAIPEASSRTRSISASESIVSAAGVERPSRVRQPSHSARASPVISPMQPLTPMEVMPPHRTHSVPHLARMSPVIYGYSYQNPQLRDSSSMGTVLDGYFALSPPLDRAAPSISPLEGDEMPPPYSASQADLLASSQSESHNQSQSRGLDDDGDNEDDGILSFSTTSREDVGQNSEENELRRRRQDAHEEVNTRANTNIGQMHHLVKQQEDVPISSKLHSFILLYILHPLRLLAALPGCVGTFWLLRNAFLLTWINGSVWQQDNRPGALEFWLASLWSLSTAYHALSFTTLLLRRWLHYYSIVPSFIRLIALQAICWPLVRLTLYIVGSNNPLASWMIISTTTAFSDTVARWVVSNIADDTLTQSERESTSIAHRGADARKRQRRRRTGMAFWRAVMGGPSEPQDNYRIRSQRRPFVESEADSDVDSIRNQRGARHSTAFVNGFQSDIASGGEESLVEQERLVRSQRIGRIFHWDVALQRNILPIAILAYLSLGAMLLEQVRQRAS